jgi:hypothetical protein
MQLTTERETCVKKTTKNLYKGNKIKLSPYIILFFLFLIFNAFNSHTMNAILETKIFHAGSKLSHIVNF